MNRLLFLCLLLTGCVQHSSLPTEHPYPTLAHLVSTYGQVHHPSLSSRLERLATRLQLPSRPFRVIVLNAPTPNAYAADDNVILITLPLYHLVRNDDELAFILAHEYGHLMLNHQQRQFEQNGRYDIESAADKFAAERLLRTGFDLRKSLQILLTDHFSYCEHKGTAYPTPSQRYSALAPYLR